MAPPHEDWGPRAYSPGRQRQRKRSDLSSMAKTSHPQASCSSSWAFCCSSGTVPSTREHCWTAKAYLTLSLQSPGSNIAVSLQKAPRAALERATTPSAPSDNLHASASGFEGRPKFLARSACLWRPTKLLLRCYQRGPICILLEWILP